MLSPRELERYARQIWIPEIGEQGQERLKRAKVFVAGVGGLGSPVCTYLAAAGIGTLRIADHDVVDPTNLNRQILHWEKDLARRKVDSAAEKLKGLNPDIEVDPMGENINNENVERLLEGFDLIVDAMDNLPTRYLLNRVAVERGIPFFHGAVYGFEGRAMTVIPGRTACLRCMHHGAVPEVKFPVIGVAPGVIGAIQATEVIKYLLGVGDLLTNRLLIFDGLDMKFREFKIRKNPQCDCCGESAGKE